MELFPATDIDQLNFIKKVIDDCDYYLLIIGGRYGSISDIGLSYTELEYQYAVEKKKPILAFLHADANKLKLKNVDTDTEKFEKLELFRTTIKSGRIVEFWTSIENLESKALVALANAFNEQPQVGWRRDTGELSLEAQQRLEKVRERYDFARDSYERERKRASEFEEKLKGYEALEDAEIEIRYTSKQNDAGVIYISAEQIIREFAASLSDGLSLSQINSGLIQYIFHKVDKTIANISEVSTRNVALFLEVFEICAQNLDGIITLKSEKKWLLKAAFKPLRKVIQDQSDDEIPF